MDAEASVVTSTGTAGTRLESVLGSFGAVRFKYKNAKIKSTFVRKMHYIIFYDVRLYQI